MMFTECIHFHSCFSWEEEISHEGLWHGSLNSCEPHCSVQDDRYSTWHLPIPSFDSYCFLLRFLCRNWACFSCVISWLDCHNQLAWKQILNWYFYRNSHTDALNSYLLKLISHHIDCKILCNVYDFHFTKIF